jgi:transposase
MRVWWHGGKFPELKNSIKEVFKMAKYHVGVDVSKRKHKACIHNLSQDSYSGVFSFEVNRQGFEKFLGTLEKFSQNKEDFIIGIEATGNYGITLSYFLLSHGYKVMEINPYRASQFRKAQGKKAKSDRIDARSLATLLSLENHKPLSIPDPVLDNLKELTRFRADMVKDRTSLVNQLHETLSTLFPELATIFSQLASPTCLSLLIAYPGPEYISHAGEARIAETLRIASRGRIGEALANALVETAQESVGVLQKRPALALIYPGRKNHSPDGSYPVRWRRK